MVNDGPLDLFAAKLKPGGEFRLATDDPTYLNWSLMVMQRHTHQFEWLVEGAGATWLAIRRRLARDALWRQGAARGPQCRISFATARLG